ncbi:MAG: phytanoyl-CoA dioxygenase family protein, partial [Methyloligellaceae bacterium]
MSVLSPDTTMSDAQVADYQEKGFVVVDDIYTPDQIGQMRAALDELIETARGLTEHTDVIDLEPSHTPDNPRVRRIKSPFKNHPVFNAMAK